MKVPDKVILTPIEEEQRKIGSRYLGIGLLSTLVPIILIAMAWLLFANKFNYVTCQFKDNGKLLAIWPLNYVYLQQFLGSKYNGKDLCFFFAMSSSASLIWLVWVCWRLFHESSRKDAYLIPYLLVATGFGIIIVVLIIPLGFSETSSSIAPSLRQSIYIGTFKVIILESELYYLVGAFIEQMFLFMRWRVSRIVR